MDAKSKKEQKILSKIKAKLRRFETPENKNDLRFRKY